MAHERSLDDVKSATRYCHAWQVPIKAHTRSLVAVPSVTVYATLGGHTCKFTHWRSEVAVGAAVWYCSDTMHDVQFRHCASEVAVAALLWYWKPSNEQSVTGKQILSVHKVAAVVRYCMGAAQAVTLAHIVSEVGVGAAEMN